MFHEVDTKDTGAVRNEVASIYASLFSLADREFITKAFQWTEDSFAGRYADYQPIDAQYHDLEHTLQVTVCYARLLAGYKRARTTPELTRRMFELALLAILLHDTGYLKKRNDKEGTGAKYTLTHVSRSAEFAAKLLSEKALSISEIISVQNMIRCTGVNAKLSSIPFQSDLERTLGYALATADLLGQMAAPDYIQKLEILYQELAESNRFNGKSAGPGFFASAAELRAKTPEFWENYVWPKITGEFGGLHKFLNVPYPNGRNEYVERVESNIRQLEVSSHINVS